MKEGANLDLFEEILSEEDIHNFEVEFNDNVEPPKVAFEKLVIDASSELIFSPLAQYFLAPFILIESNGILDIPFRSKFTYDKVLKEVATHFNKVIKITEDNQVTLSMQDVRESSKAYFLDLYNNNSLNAIVTDLFKNSSTGWGEIFPAKEYKVNLEGVEKLVDHDIVTLWSFFKETFIINNGYFVLMPSGWAFDESFKDRIAVRTFAGMCNSMTITVNTESNTISSVFIN